MQTSDHNTESLETLRLAALHCATDISHPKSSHPKSMPRPDKVPIGTRIAVAAGRVSGADAVDDSEVDFALVCGVARTLSRRRIARARA